MAYFHVTAVFDTRGASQEDADRAAEAVVKSVHHPRVYFYEKDTSGGLGPFPPGKALYFTTIAEYDVEASTEEQAGEIADEVLDALSTKDVQYLGLGVVPGSLRVSAEQRREREERPAEPEAGEEQEEREEHDGKGRRPRGRRRKRGPEREARPAEERRAEGETRAPSREPRAVVSEVDAVPADAPVEPAPVAHAPGEGQTLEVVDFQPLDTPPPPPPLRSSASMRVTLTVNIRASELFGSGAGAVDQHELIAAAVAEARRRHPELPADIVPESATAPLPAGDTLLLLTWHFDRPVPSASEAA